VASAVSYELLISKFGTPNGVATLDGAGLVPVSQLPNGVFGPYRGQYATSDALFAAFPIGTYADYAYVLGTSSYWYWNVNLAHWVNQQITEADYLLLSVAAKAAVPYIVI